MNNTDQTTFTDHCGTLPKEDDEQIAAELRQRKSEVLKLETIRSEHGWAGPFEVEALDHKGDVVKIMQSSDGATWTEKSCETKTVADVGETLETAMHDSRIKKLESRVHELETKLIRRGIR